MSKVRAVRLSPFEEKQVQEFLESNPFFDFSSLARVAVIEFIKNPTIQITPIQSKISRQSLRTERRKSEI